MNAQPDLFGLPAPRETQELRKMRTSIAWATHSWNAWIGCTQVCPACHLCYAKADMDDRRHFVEWNGPPRRTKNWQKVRRLNVWAAATGERVLLFANNYSDTFDNNAPDEWRADLWQLIRETPAITWQVLTKRVVNAPKAGMLPADWGAGYPNVWLGISVWDQAAYRANVPRLLAIPAAVRFLSVEPMLGPVRLDHGRAQGLRWCIVGGESEQRGARPVAPMALEWAQALVEDCCARQVAPFVKQLGAKPMLAGVPYPVSDGHGERMEEWPAALRVRGWPAP